MKAPDLIYYISRIKKLMARAGKVLDEKNRKSNEFVRLVRECYGFSCEELCPRYRAQDQEFIAFVFVISIRQAFEQGTWRREWSVLIDLQEAPDGLRRLLQQAWGRFVPSAYCDLLHTCMQDLVQGRTYSKAWVAAWSAWEQPALTSSLLARL